MFLKSLFSKKRQEEEKEMEPEEVKEWIRNENRVFTAETESLIGESYGRLGEKLLNLQQELRNFRQSDIHPDVLERLKRAARTNKLMIEKNLQLFIDSISVPEKKDLKVAEQFWQFASGRIAELGKKNGRGLVIVREALHEDTRNLTASLGEFESEVADFGRILAEKGPRLKEVEEIVMLTGELKSKMNRGPEIKKEIHNLESGLQLQEQKLRGAMEKVDRQEQSTEMKRLEKTKKSLNEFEKKKKQLEDRMIQEMANFEKALKKVEYHTEEKKSKAIRKYMEEPVDSLLKPDGLKLFKELVSYLKEAVRNEDFGLSEKARGKALLGIGRVESGVMDWTLKEYEDLEDKISQLKRKINNNKAPEKKREEEEEKESWEKAIKNTKKRIEDLKEEEKGLDKKIKDIRSLLEKKIEKVSEKKVRVI